MFPEGGSARAFEVCEPLDRRRAAGSRGGGPIIPVAVWGGHRLLAKGQRSRMRERFGVPVLFSFGSPIVIDETTTCGTRRPSCARTAAAHREMQAEYPVDGTGRWWQPHRRGGTAPTVDEAAAADLDARAAPQSPARRRKGLTGVQALSGAPRS